MTEEKDIIFADIFPNMDAHPTKDPRVFQTPFKTVQKNEGLHTSIKAKKYFCCIVGKDCWGIDVFRESAVDAREACDEAYFKIKAAADYYEQHGQWPPEHADTETEKGS